MNPFGEVTGFLDAAVAVAVVLIGVSLVLTFIRLIKGPSLADRVVALDLFTVLAMGIVGLRVVATGEVLYLEIAIALGLVAFLATVFFARLIETRGRELSHGYDIEDREGER
jgi:multicomponent Na+:H+ antiporter subunit F